MMDTFNKLKLEFSVVAVLAAVSIIGFVITLAFFYPGYRSFDSDWQLCQALGECSLDSWHPVSMALVWKLLLGLTGGYVPVMLLLQVSMFWVAIFLISLWAWNKTRSWKVTALAFAVAFLPNVFNIIGVIWKDVHMMSALLLSVAIALHLPQRKLWVKVVVGVIIAVLVSYAVSVRSNAIAAILPLVILYVCLSKSPSRLYQKILLAAISLLSLLLINPLINMMSSPNIAPSSVTMYAYDIVNILPANRIASESPVEIRQTLIKLSDCSVFTNGKTILSFWGCVDQGEVKNNLSENNTYILKKYWRDVVMRHPVQYAAQKAETYAQFMFSDVGRLVWLNGGGVFDSGNDNFNRINSSISKSLRSLNQSYVEDFGYRHFSFIYKPWFWLLVGIGLMLYAKRLHYYKPWVYGLTASAVLYILSYAPASVTSDYRYIYWSVIAILVAGLMTIVDTHSSVAVKKKTKGRRKS